MDHTGTWDEAHEARANVRGGHLLLFRYEHLEEGAQGVSRGVRQTGGQASDAAQRSCILRTGLLSCSVMNIVILMHLMISGQYMYIYSS